LHHILINRESMKKINTIAIIDDDDIYKYTAKKTILETEFVNNIITFSDGQEAIEFFLEKQGAPDELPDIIFLDINMPILDGWQFLEEYAPLKNKIQKEIQIYVTSSSTNPDDLIQAKNITAVSDYIIKPLSIERFKEIFEKLKY